MTSCNREHSPVLKRKEKERHMDLVMEPEKIHRIFLTSPALCTLADVESPNCIWFKLVNNIAEQLHIVKPAQLEPLVSNNKQLPADINNNQHGENADEKNGKEEQQQQKTEGTGENGIATFVKEEKITALDEAPIQKYKYVMAPLEENVYARGRIIQLQDIQIQGQKIHQFAYVHFIDEGYGAWMSTKCLAKMEPSLYNHPWQAFPIALFKLTPGYSGQWPSHFTDVLIEIMSEYEYFKVVPVIDSRRNLNYFEYRRATVYGLESLEDDEGPDGTAESITHRLKLEYGKELFRSVGEEEEELDGRGEVGPALEDTQDSLLDEAKYDRTLFDAKHHKLLREPNHNLTSEHFAEMPKWRLKWPKRFGLAPKKMAMATEAANVDGTMEENGNEGIVGE